AFGRYVCAHAYSVEAIRRAAHAGVRTIEHGNLIDEPTARLMASKDMYLIANLVTYYEMKSRAAEYGMSSDMLAKNDLVIDGGRRSLEICQRAGVPVAYGTDLLGQLQSEQSREFIIRSQVQKPIEIIRAATLLGAEIVRQVGRLGCLKAGAFADLLLVEGNPLRDLGSLQEQGKYLAVIMKAGRFHKNRLHYAMAALSFKNFRLLDRGRGELRDGYQLLVEGERIWELAETPIRSGAAEVIDCGGRTLMPGLIDCHVHVIHSEVNIRFLEAMPLTLLTARASLRLRAMLDRGFTTVRDTGGCDWGIKTAVAQ